MIDSKTGIQICDHLQLVVMFNATLVNQDERKPAVKESRSAV